MEAAATAPQTETPYPIIVTGGGNYTNTGDVAEGTNLSMQYIQEERNAGILNNCYDPSFAITAIETYGDSGRAIRSLNNVMDRAQSVRNNTKSEHVRDLADQKISETLGILRGLMQLTGDIIVNYPFSIAA